MCEPNEREPTNNNHHFRLVGLGRSLSVQSFEKENHCYQYYRVCMITIREYNAVLPLLERARLFSVETRGTEASKGMRDLLESFAQLPSPRMVVLHGRMVVVVG